MLLGYLYGITSERRLAEEARLHLAFRWFLGYDLDETPPDHSMLSKARARFGLPVYQAAFTEVVRSASGPAWCGATSSTWTARWSKPMPVLGRPARGRCSLSCRARPGTSRRCGRRIPSPIPRRQRPSRRGEQPAPDSAGGLTAGGGAPVAARGRSGGRAQRGPGAGERLGDQSHRSRRGAGQARGGPLRLLLQGARRRGRRAGASHHRAGRDPGEVADEHLLDRLLKEHRGTTGRTVAEVVADTKYGTTPTTWRWSSRASGRASRPTAP